MVLVTVVLVVAVVMIVVVMVLVVVMLVADFVLVAIVMVVVMVIVVALIVTVVVERNFGGASLGHARIGSQKPTFQGGCLIRKYQKQKMHPIYLPNISRTLYWIGILLCSKRSCGMGVQSNTLFTQL